MFAGLAGPSRVLIFHSCRLEDKYFEQLPRLKTNLHVRLVVKEDRAERPLYL